MTDSSHRSPRRVRGRRRWGVATLTRLWQGPRRAVAYVGGRWHRIGALVSAVLVLWAVLAELGGPRVVIHELTLPSRLREGGYDPDSATRLARDRVPAILRAMIAEVVGQERGQLVAVGREAHCVHNVFLFNHLDRTLLDQVAARSRLRSDSLDIAVVPGGHSLHDFLVRLRRLFGGHVVQVLPAVTEDKDGLTVRLTVHAGAGTSLALARPLDPDTPLPDAVARLLAAVIAPELVASTTRTLEPADLEESVAVARDILRDETAVVVTTLQLIRAHTQSISQADRRTDWNAATVLAGELYHDLEAMPDVPMRDLIRLGLLEVMLAAAMADRLLLTSVEDDVTSEEFARLAEPHRNAIRLVDHYAASLVATARAVYDQSGRGAVASFIMARIEGYPQTPAARAGRLRADLDRWLADPVLTPRDKVYLHLAVIDAMGDAGLPGVDEEFLRLRQRVAAAGAAIAPGLRDSIDLTEAMIRLERGETERAGHLFNTFGPSTSPCILAAAVEEVVEVARRPGVTVNWTGGGLTAARLADFAQWAVDGGLRNFHAYNLLGHVNANAGRFAESYRAYALALDHAGDPAWALLNWGHTARRAGDLPLARRKFEASLAQAPILSAVYGLLQTLDELGASDAYLETYATYWKQLNEATAAIRLHVSRTALRHHCKLGRRDPFAALIDERLVRQGFDTETCHLHDPAVPR